MQTVADLLHELPAFGSIAPEHRETIAGCGRNSTYEAGAFLLKEGEPADEFFVIRKGAVTIETFVPQRGSVTLETLHEGDLLGWSWLFSPRRTVFDARALETTHTIRFDGACLRGKCESDPVLGYDVYKVFAGVVVNRLQDTRMQLLNVYDAVPGR